MNDMRTTLTALLTQAQHLAQSSDNPTSHKRLADYLTKYGKRMFGPRFGETGYHPTMDETGDVDLDYIQSLAEFAMAEED